jgi:type I restriction enzyme S subunit
MKNVDFSEVIDFLEGPGVRNWQFTDSGIKLINIRNLVNDKINLENTTNHLSEEEVSKKYNHFLLKEGDYIMASSGVTWGKIAEVKKEHLPLCLNTSIIKLRPKYDDFEKKYLWYFIKSNIFTKQIDKIITGSAQPNFGPSHLKKVKIPLPPLSQQQKIANILDAADALRQNDKALIAKYDELTQSLFLDMFGDPVSNPKGWEKREIVNLINHNRPITYGILMPKEDVKPFGIPYIKVVDVKDGQILHDKVCHTTEEIESKYKRSRLKENDLLLSIRGHVGRICIVPEIYINANITQDTARLDFKKEIEPLFAEYCLGSKEFQRYMSKYVKGAGVKGINLGDLKKLLLIVPDMGIQKKFVEYSQSLKIQKTIAQASLAKSEELFNSLLQKAFKGELA